MQSGTTSRRRPLLLACAGLSGLGAIALGIAAAIPLPVLLPVLALAVAAGAAGGAAALLGRAPAAGSPAAMGASGLAAAPLSQGSPAPQAREDDADRRQHPRTPMRQAVQLELPGRPTVAANLLDLSEAGAGVEAPLGAIAPGAEGRLVLDTSVIPVRIVAVADRRVGLHFIAPSEQALATIRRVLAEAELATIA